MVKPNSIHLIILSMLALSGQVQAKLPPGEKIRDAKVELGRQIFMDNTLSEPAGQACASCHQPSQAFADPGKIVSPGANPALFGNRNAPSISYARFIPPRHFSVKDQTWIGGQFLDGRANTLRAQAKGTFLNPLEMGNASAAAVMQKILSRPYADQFIQLYGWRVRSNDNAGLNAIADALATYEKYGNEFAQFSSKYDAYLRGEVQLTDEELRGLTVFEDEKKGNCAACHPNRPGKDNKPPLFTDFSYDNLGVPVNPSLPFFQMSAQYNPEGNNFRDQGLGKIVKRYPGRELGKFKVPTLRNINRTAPYMHNGVFTTLREVVEFYNTRDIDSHWGEPEVPDNVNREELGNLKLTESEVDDLVAFLKTLDDSYSPTGNQ